MLTLSYLACLEHCVIIKTAWACFQRCCAFSAVQSFVVNGQNPASIAVAGNNNARVMITNFPLDVIIHTLEKLRLL